MELKGILNCQQLCPPNYQLDSFPGSELEKLINMEYLSIYFARSNWHLVKSWLRNPGMMFCHLEPLWKSVESFVHSLTHWVSSMEKYWDSCGWCWQAEELTFSPPLPLFVSMHFCLHGPRRQDPLPWTSLPLLAASRILSCSLVFV